ncbi:MAG: DMT family transporter [Prevotellaceae bacterium]|jgi:drug/metabolite transporter (DMT)-like permease|nr:DMT family transporter [Prevotellaceae bacterium]
MNYFGELIAIVVACSWCCTALFFEYAGKRIGSLQVNLIRLLFAFVLLGSLLLITSGRFFPVGADSKTWLWMSLSGLVGFVFGDFCLFYSYTLITARFSQLMMTLAPPFAAFFGLLFLDERLGKMGLVGMVITLFGIAISILKRSGGKNGGLGLHFQIPVRGVLFALGGALGQGLGIVLSKKGMNYYNQCLGDQEFFANYIPFAATYIRIITGIIGFTLIILLSGRKDKFIQAVHNKKGMLATLGGAFFGPFLGVSLSLTAIKYTETGIASTIMATVPILILIPYAIIYKQLPKWIEVVGAILCVLGVGCFFLR